MGAQIFLSGVTVLFFGIFFFALAGHTPPDKIPSWFKAVVLSFFCVGCSGAVAGLLIWIWQ